MFAGGQFGHDAAVFGVQLDLRGNDAGQDPAVAHDGGAGFVAGSFKGQKSHVYRSDMPADRRINFETTEFSPAFCRKPLRPILQRSHFI